MRGTASRAGRSSICSGESTPRARSRPRARTAPPRPRAPLRHVAHHAADPASRPSRSRRAQHDAREEARAVPHPEAVLLGARVARRAPELLRLAGVPLLRRVEAGEALTDDLRLRPPGEPLRRRVPARHDPARIEEQDRVPVEPLGHEAHPLLRGARVRQRTLRPAVRCTERPDDHGCDDRAREEPREPDRVRGAHDTQAPRGREGQPRVPCDARERGEQPPLGTADRRGQRDRRDGEHEALAPDQVRRREPRGRERERRRVGPRTRLAPAIGRFEHVNTRAPRPAPGRT
jgi:hypothetical protein